MPGLPFLAAALLAPLLAGAALAAPDDPGMHVPRGRVGDVVTYDRLEPDGNGGLAHAATVRFQVIGHDEVLDEHRRPRQALQLGVSLDDGETPGSLRAWQSVDVQTRAVLQAGFVNRFEQGFRLFGGLGQRPTITPADDASGFELPITDSEAVVHAGRPYAPDDALHAEGARLAATWSLPPIAQFQAQLGDVALLDGHEVRPLHLSGRVAPASGPAEDADGDGMRPFLATRVPVGRESAFQRTIWLSATQAYPLLIHDRYEGAEHAEVVQQLRALEPGQAPFGWGNEEALARSPPAVPAQAMPGDSMTSPCLRFEDARLQADNDLRLASFQAWRRLHPGAVLVGLGASCPQSGMDVERQAFLSYGDPASGDGYTVWLRPANEASWALSAGESFPGQYPPEAFLHLAEARMGWGEAEEAWREIAGGPVLGATWGMHSSAMARDAGGPAIGGYLGAPGTLLVQGGASGGAAQSSASFDGTRGSVMGLHSSDWGVLDGWLFAVDSLAAGVAGAADNEGKEAGFGAAGPPRFPIATLLPVVYGVGVLAALGVLVKWLLSGFVRIDGPAALRHPTRLAIFELVRAEPGIGLARIVQLLGVPKGTVSHHLWVLQRAALLASIRDGRHRRHFEAGSLQASSMQALALLRNERTRAVLADIVHRPGVCRRDVARGMGLSAPAVGKHLKRLSASGLVVVEAAGRRRLYHARIDPERHGPLLESMFALPSDAPSR